MRYGGAVKPLPASTPLAPGAGEWNGSSLLMAVLCLSVLSYGVANSLVGPILPVLARELGTDATQIAWVMTAFLLSSAVAAPILGRVADARGKKPVLVLSLVFLAVGSAIGAVAGSLPVMIAARAVQGAGGGVLPIAFGVVRDEFARHRVAGAIGALGGLSGAGAGVGVTLAGPIVGAFGYHWAFWLPTVVCVAALVAVLVVAPSSSVHGDGGINAGAAVALAAWLVLLLVAVTNGPGWGWGSGRVLVLLGAAAALAVAWLVVELRSRVPLIDVRLLVWRSVATNNAVTFGISIVTWGTFVSLPLFVQAPRSTGYGLGATPTVAGLMVLPQVLAIFVVGPATGPLSRLFGARAVVVGSPLLCAAGQLFLAGAHGHAWQIYAAATVNGVGIALSFSLCAGLIGAAVPAERAGAALGMNANLRVVGGAIGSALVATVLAASHHVGGQPVERGYTDGFVVLAGIALLCLVPALLVPDVTDLGPAPVIALTGELVPLDQPRPTHTELSRRTE